MKFTNVIFLVFFACTGTLQAQTTVYLEDFESGIPANFTLFNLDGLTPAAQVSEYTAPWIAKTDLLDDSNSVASSTSYFDPAGRANRWLITPTINLGAYGNILSWKGLSHDGSFPEDYIVLISTTDTATSSFTDTLLEVYDEPNFWSEHTINLSDSGYNNQAVHIAFVLNTMDGFKLYVDSIQVVKEDPLGIEALNQQQLTLYPNPTAKQLTIQTEIPIQWLRIKNNQGQLILKSVDKQVDVSTLPAGVYFVEVKTQNELLVKRFTKR